MHISIKTMNYLFATVLLLAMMAASLQPAEAGHEQNGIVGAWTVEGQPDGAPPFLNTVTNHIDRTVVNADPLFGTGHGVWERIGKRKFAVKFVTITSPFHPLLPNTIITVEGEVKLAKSRDSASGDFETTFTDLNGNPIMPPSTGTIELSRIQ